MADAGPLLDWLVDDEVVYQQTRSLVLVQEIGSIVRRKARGTCYLTDRRVVVRTGRRRANVFVNVPREHIASARAIPALRMSTSYYRPFPGRRVLRLDVRGIGQAMVVGIVLPTAEAAAWQTELTI